MVKGFLPGIDFHPVILRLTVGFLPLIEHVWGAPDIRSDAVSLDKRQDRHVGDMQDAVLDRYFFPHLWNLDNFCYDIVIYTLISEFLIIILVLGRILLPHRLTSAVIFFITRGDLNKQA